MPGFRLLSALLLLTPLAAQTGIITTIAGTGTAGSTPRATSPPSPAPDSPAADPTISPLPPALSLDVLSFAQGTVTATLGGISAVVQFAGLAPGFVGLGQVNVIAP
jgi:uncharacterized protein (TIGR03437 family)